MEESLLLSLIDAAVRNDFDYIDNSLKNLSENKFIPLVQWAVTYGHIYKNGNVRDLAGTILEKAPIPEHIFNYVREPIAEAMKTEEENKGAKYRFAFALAAHGPGEYKESVVSILEKALEDNEVSAIAKGYLKKLGN